MKLSELVAYKNYIDEIDISPMVDQCNHGLSDVILKIKNFQADLSEPLEQMDTLLFVANNVFTNFNHALHHARLTIEQAIDQAEDAYFENSRSLYSEMQNDTPEYILNRRKVIDNDTAALIRTRVKLNSDWQHPGMVIRPGIEPYVEDMVASDPLYIVDLHDDLLQPCRRRFTPEYQNRLRYYVVDDSVPEPIFKNLPKEQIGTAICYNFFHYKSIEVIQRYLIEIYDLLKPGGVFAFTYNNCDLADAVRLVEHHFHCYTPGRWVKNIATQIGFEIIYELNTRNGTYWIELKKSGTKQSIRGGQTLALIVPKKTAEHEKKSKYPSTSVPDTVDKPNVKVYTDDEVLRLQISATLLGIDTEERLFSIYSPEKLDRLVELRLNLGGIEIEKFNEKLERMFNKRKKT